ncbi:unnamed protein product [Tetraodon nigroviridis]|uniref:(spotted green pufferfish) hypothetical protein n=1 Tax=Tetraodon nigroviridis TaxID=99883 RepID=Q4S5T5_TETNG|nr:unnamed protein product [Tetraodon nigroviridis]
MTPPGLFPVFDNEGKFKQMKAAATEAVHQTHSGGHSGLRSKQAHGGSRPAVVAGPLTLKDLWRSKSNPQQEGSNREEEEEGCFTGTHVATESWPSQ